MVERGIRDLQKAEIIVPENTKPSMLEGRRLPLCCSEEPHPLSRDHLARLGRLAWASTPSLDDAQLLLARLSACQEIGVTRRLSILTATPGERIGVHCVDEAIYWKSVIVLRRILAPIPNLNRVDSQ